MSLSKGPFPHMEHKLWPAIWGPSVENMWKCTRQKMLRILFSIDSCQYWNSGRPCGQALTTGHFPTSGQRWYFCFETMRNVGCTASALQFSASYDVRCPHSSPLNMGFCAFSILGNRAHLCKVPKLHAALAWCSSQKSGFWPLRLEFHTGEHLPQA